MLACEQDVCVCFSYCTYFGGRGGSLRLWSLLYLCEVAEDGSVLTGVVLELPRDGSGPVLRREFFWSSAWCCFMNAYEQDALHAIRNLQGLYIVC